MVYDANVLHLERERRHYPFSQAERTVSEALFRREGGTFVRLYNVHLSGKPHGPARQELATFLQGYSDPIPTILLGDFNFSEAALRPAFEASGLRTVFAAVDYATNTAPFSLTAKRIDHVIVIGDAGVMPLGASKMMPSVAAASKLISHRWITD